MGETRENHERNTERMSGKMGRNEARRDDRRERLHCHDRGSGCAGAGARNVYEEPEPVAAGHAPGPTRDLGRPHREGRRDPHYIGRWRDTSTIPRPAGSRPAGRPSGPTRNSSATVVQRTERFISAAPGGSPLTRAATWPTFGMARSGAWNGEEIPGLQDRAPDGPHALRE